MGFINTRIFYLIYNTRAKNLCTAWDILKSDVFVRIDSFFGFLSNPASSTCIGDTYARVACSAGNTYVKGASTKGAYTKGINTKSTCARGVCTRVIGDASTKSTSTKSICTGSACIKVIGGVCYENN